MITSFSNPLVKRIKRFRQKKYRERESAYFVEGLRVVMSANCLIPSAIPLATDGTRKTGPNGKM